MSMGSARLLRLVMLMALAFAAASARAGGLETLDRFLAEVQAGQGEFVQTVSARSGRKPRVSSGEFAFARPGRFIWRYRKPYPQLLVGDGKRMWAYDEELNQVTVKTLGDALGSTPAAILAGRGEIARNFELAADGISDGLEWVDAKPLSSDSPFTSMRLGFADGALREMHIRDGFGQATRLEFTRFERNPALDDTLFRFIPPPGADVVGE